MTVPVSHERAFELLPWLVNGTLAGSEREAVEEHARTCIACRREWKHQRQLHAAVRARQTTDVSAEAGFEQLDRELDTVRRTDGRRSRYSGAARYAVAAAAGIAVLAVLLWFTPLPQATDRTYSTLTTPAFGDAALLDIVFAADTTAAEMQALLDQIGGEIVAGPSELGRYSVRMRDDAADDSRLAELLGTLAADPRVRFAGPSLAEVQP
jgi:hypothetical protein